jgi:LPS export ABC transporter protein LptC
MFFKLRTSALSIHFVLILSGILLNWACQPYEETKHLQASGAIQDSLFRYTESEGVHISMFEKGYRYLEISSNFAKTHQSSSENFTIFSGNVNINLFDSLLALKSAVVCSTATYNNITNTFSFLGAVSVLSETNKQLFTEQLRWFRDTRAIESDAFVKIYTEKDTIYGFGLVSDEALESYRIKQVSGNITIEN